MKEKKAALCCEDPYNIITAVKIEKSKIVERTKTKIPWNAFFYKSFDKEKGDRRKDAENSPKKNPPCAKAMA